MSDQLPPPGGGPDEDRPAPLIPSRAARHQKKGGLRRTRPPKPAPVEAAPPRPADDRPPDDRPAEERPPRAEPKEPRRRPALKAPQLRVPQLRAPQLGDVRGTSLGLAGIMVVAVARPK